MCYTNKQYENRVKKLVELETAKKELEKEIEALKVDIQTDMGDTEHIETDRCKIHFPVIISTRFDSKAFRADHERLYRDYCKETTSRRFSYSVA